MRHITKVPNHTELIDITLSKTQRKTPTEIHKTTPIGRIRKFYLRKVKFCSEEFSSRLNTIVSEFPKIDDVHPFYGDLINILYDKDHYKLALSHLHVVSTTIERIATEYSKLLRYGDSLYRCKQLKRAALGRMATAVKGLKAPLVYLEDVRQHMARLPNIDTTERTLLLCGFPNVGKSSFMNSITRADVDVQPYPFTTKSLYVGHTEHGYGRWQVIDTPGVLDKALEERNTIEMLSIAALAHLNSVIVYFIDLSERCGYSIEQQLMLYESLKPLFSIKPMVFALNKTDVAPLAEHPKRELILSSCPCYVEISAIQSVNVTQLKDTACTLLLENVAETEGVESAYPIEALKVFRPSKVVDRERLCFEPTGHRYENEYELQEAKGGAGSYYPEMHKWHLLPEEYIRDVVPEIVNGMNIADYVDPEIEERVKTIEREEEEMHKSGAYDVEVFNENERELLGVWRYVDDRRNAHREMTELNRSKHGVTRTQLLNRPANRRESNVLLVPAVSKEMKSAIDKYVDVSKQVYAKMPKHLMSGKRRAKATRR